MDPGSLEELLAPVALYPDPVLGQVLVAATNPQEVLDAGNWLLQNQALQGKALDEAAKQVGFTPPVRGLLQAPEVIDMMCSELGWTTELGQAFVNDQAAVLDAVQRLRAQAKDAGNLQTSPQMKVATETQQGHEVITVSPPNPQVVYVPQYDPVAAYAPAPAAPVTPVQAPTAAPAAEDQGHSTGTLVATGLLSFGAGMLVANIFDDDDDDRYKNGYYNPKYYGPPMPYYPPYPYRPGYGNGYYPSKGYSRPPDYQHSFNNNTIIVNTDNDNYWNRFDDKPGSPRSAPAAADSWKGQGSYAGAAQGAKSKAQVNAAKPAGVADAKGKAASVSSAKPAAKTAANSPPQLSKPAAKPAAKPATKPAVSPERAKSGAAAGAKAGGAAERAESGRDKKQASAGASAKAKDAKARDAKVRKPN